MSAQQHAGDGFKPMTVSVLRDNSTQRVVFMETTKDFVEALGACMHASVGSLAQFVEDQLDSETADLGSARVMRSLCNLRDDIWEGNKDSMLPSKTVSMANDTPAKLPCPLCSLKNEFPTEWQQLGWGGQRYGANRCQLCGGSYGNGPGCTVYHCQSCQQNEATYRQQLVNQSRSNTQIAQFKPKPTPAFEKTVRFIVTDSLEVFENSSIKALEILSKKKTDLSHISTEQVSLTKSIFQRIIACMLLNHTETLTVALA